jgi:hypothetical protein
MATKAELLAEAYRRNLMPPEQRAAYEEAQRRGLLEPGSGGAVYGSGEYAGQPLSRGQERNLSAGGTNALAPVGSSGNMRAETPALEGPNATGMTLMRDGSVVDVGASDPISTKMMAAGSGLVSGALLGSKNEIAAGLSTIPNALSGDFSGIPQRFSDNLAKFDESDRILRENHPWLYYGGGLAGTVATAPLTPVVRGGSTAVRVGGNAAINAGLGGYAGFMGTDGDLGDRAVGGAVGATMGGVLAGGATYAGRARPPSAPLPDELAALPERSRRRVAKRLKKVMSDLSPQQRAEMAAAANPNMIAAEAFGPRVRGEALANATAHPETAARYNAIRVERQRGRPGRIADAFEGATGIAPADAQNQLRARVDAGQAEVAPMFEGGFANPGGPMSPRIEQLLATDAGRRAQNHAFRILSNQTRNPRAEGLTFTDNLDEWASESGGGLFSQSAPGAPPASAAAATPADAARVVRRGKKLSTFLADQGGIQIDGEGVARDFDKFQRKVLREGGINWGDAAQRALDAGFFPEVPVDGTVTREQLISALKAEMDGSPRYARELSGRDQDALNLQEQLARFGPEPEVGPAPTDFNDAYQGRPEPMGQPVYQEVPSWRGAETTMRGLDKVIEGYRNQTTGLLPDDDAVLDSVIEVRRNLRAELLKVYELENPPLARALENSSDYLQARGVHNDAAKQILNKNVTAEQFAEMAGRANPGNQQFVDTGVAHAIWDRADKGALTSKMFANDRIEAKLRSRFGDAVVDDFARALREEDAMAAFEQRIPSEAESNRILTQIVADQDSNMVGQMVGEAALAMAFGAPQMAVVNAGRVPLRRLATNGKRAFAMPDETRDALGRVLEGRPSSLNALLDHQPPPSAAVNALRQGMNVVPRVAYHSGHLTGQQ